jgi:hypothetical protein
MTGDGGDGGGCSTPMSLPVPGFSLLYESNSQAINKFARHAYAGIPPGEGLNLRSALVAPGMTAIATEAVIRTHVYRLIRAQSRNGQQGVTHCAYGLLGR